MNIPVATNDIDGPEGKLKKYERYNPLKEATIPNKTLNFIEFVNVFVTNFADAAGIISMLRTKIMPTVWSEPIIASESIIRNK